MKIQSLTWKIAATLCISGSVGCAQLTGHRPYTIDPVGVYFSKSRENLVVKGNDIVVGRNVGDLVTIGKKQYRLKETGCYTLYVLD